MGQSHERADIEVDLAQFIGNRLLVERGLLCKGDKVVFVAGTPVGSAGSTNLMKLHRVGAG